MNENGLIQKLNLLLEDGGWENMQLASQLMKGFGYQAPHLQLLIRRIVRLYFQDFLPNTDYHRIGCTLINRTTFTLIHEKINEFLNVPYTEIQVSYEGLNFRNWILCSENQSSTQVETFLEDFAYNLHFSVQATFQIGLRP